MEEEKKIHQFCEVEPLLYLRESSDPFYRKTIFGPGDAMVHIAQILKRQPVEKLLVICYTSHFDPICYSVVSTGNISSTMIPVASILRVAMLSNAARILMVHNHPSGSPQPSTEDIEFTRQLYHIMKLVQCPLMDSLIIGGGISGKSPFFSFRRDTPDEDNVWVADGKASGEFHKT